jgi:mono/diheme cytochrome c family protein
MARIALAIGVLAVLGLAAWTVHTLLPREEEQTFLYWRDPTITTHGEGLYRVHCSMCHGMPDGSMPAGAGNEAAPPHDANGHTWQHPDFALFQLIRDGVAVANCVPVDPDQMPRFKGILTDAELVAVLSYIKSTWPDETRQYHDKVNMMYGPYNRAVSKLIDIKG